MLHIVLLLMAPGAWGSCPQSAPVWSPPVFAQPLPAPVFLPQAPVVIHAVSPAVARYAEHLKKSRSRPSECLDGCSCGECDGDCKCVTGGARCGGNCRCLTGSAVTADAATTGVDFSKVGDKAKYTRCGKHGKTEVSRSDAIRMVEASAVPDDANKPWVVVVLSDAERLAATAAFKNAPEFSPYRDKFRFQSYAPDHWYVAYKGFAPGVTVMKADGTKPLSIASWDPSAVAKMLYKASPDYDPSKDPDLKKPAPPPNATPAPLDQLDQFVKSLPPWAFYLMGFGGLYLLLRQPDSNKDSPK